METFLSKFFQSQFIHIQGELFDEHLQSKEKVWPPNIVGLKLGNVTEHL